MGIFLDSWFCLLAPCLSMFGRMLAKLANRTHSAAIYYTDNFGLVVQYCIHVYRTFLTDENIAIELSIGRV